MNEKFTMASKASNSFGTRDRLTVDDTSYQINRLDRIDGSERLPYSLKVVLENLVRNEDGRLITAAQPTRWRPGIWRRIAALAGTWIACVARWPECASTAAN
jgi:hypothetical protein